jgi:hypothetical protein
VSGLPELTKATITLLPLGSGPKVPICVHFNPVSLQYSVTNTMKEGAEGNKTKQYVASVTGKLTMDLVFDNTNDGQDVQQSTSKLASCMGPAPTKDGAQNDPTPPIVLFEWGHYKFQGMMESYKETIDFFSPDGVPLRASVNITLAQQDKQFNKCKTSAADKTLKPDAVNVPGLSPQTTADQGGDPSAARTIALMNGEASLRFSAGASLTVSGSVDLGPPVAFASGGAGIGIGGGAGIGISGGAGIGISGGAGIGIGGGAGIGMSAGAGISISASADAQGNIFGSSASAGISATEGAFAALRTPPSTQVIALNTDNFLPPSGSLALSTSSADGFQVGGSVTAVASAGLSADVGVSADLRARIQFEG